MAVENAIHREQGYLFVNLSKPARIQLENSGVCSVLFNTAHTEICSWIQAIRLTTHVAYLCTRRTNTGIYIISINCITYLVQTVYYVRIKYLVSIDCISCTQHHSEFSSADVFLETATQPWGCILKHIYKYAKRFVASSLKNKVFN